MLVVASTPVRAGDFCADLGALTRNAQTGFADGARVMSHPDHGPGTCDVALTLGAPSAHICHWEYPYRAPEAEAAFKAFNRAVQSCFDGSTHTKDRGVNHPDFYDLRQYDVADARVSVSIKDKGAMQRTFVFLRVEGRDME